MPRNAKPGDKITAKATSRIRRFNRHMFTTPEECVVYDKSPGDAGQWVCIDCGELPQNNMQASSHIKSHRLAWRNFESGRLEEP